MTNQESDGGSGGRHDAPQSTQGNLSLHGTISFTSPQQPDSDRRQPAQYPTSNQTGFDRWLQRIGAVFAIIFGGALVVVGVLQWLVYDEQTKNAFATGRAYVLFASADSGMTIPMKPKKEISITTHNFGQTPADLRSNGGDCKYYAGDPGRILLTDQISGLTDQFGRLPPGIIIGADKDVGTFKLPVDATDEEIARASRGDGKIICRLRIDYDDIIKARPHQTHICLFWLAVAKEPYQGAFAAYPGDCNYHD
jgi:hypothetical protein